MNNRNARAWAGYDNWLLRGSGVDEHEIEIIYATLLDKANGKVYNLIGSDRTKTYINCCEKAFEILEGQL